MLYGCMLLRHEPRICSIRSRNWRSRPSCPLLRETAVDTLASHDTLGARHGGSHAIRVDLRVVGLNDLRHEGSVKSLLLSDGAILVRKQESLQIDNFLT